MESNERDIDEVLKDYFAPAPEEDVEAALRRVLARLQAQLNEFKGEFDTVQALRQVTFEPLQADDLPVLQAVSRTGVEGQVEQIFETANWWFYKEFTRETVAAALERLERYGWVSASAPDDNAARVFALTTEGQAALSRAREQAKALVPKPEED